MSGSPELDALAPRTWEDKDWESVLYPILYRQCVPFLGAGASAGVLPLGKAIAREWAKHYQYPFRDWRNLSRVAQYVAVEVAELAPKYRLKAMFSGVSAGGARPDFGNVNEPHRVLAGLPFPIYITTNYDNFMVEALKHVGKTPRKEVCRWYEVAKPKGERYDPSESVAPEPEKLEANPIVYHLHGDLEDLRSMVLTEDDYLDFLINIGEAIPTYIRAAFANSTLLFIGYSLEDINFRVLFRGLGAQTRGGQGDRHISVQLHPDAARTARRRLRVEKQLKYLRQHFNYQKVKVYWGTAEEFMKELRERWEGFSGGV